MRGETLARRSVMRLEATVATVAAAAFGVGVVVAVTGAVTDDVPVAVAGGVVAAAGLGLLMAAGWVDSLFIVAMSLALPAVYSTDEARLSTAAIVTAVALVSWLIARSAGRSARLQAVPQIPVLALLAAVLLATVFAQEPLLAIRESVNIIVMLGLLAIATDELTARPERVRSLALVLGGAVGIVGLLAGLQGFGFIPASFQLRGTAFNRASLGFGWPNELASYIAISIPFAVYAAQTARHRAWKLIAAVGVATAVFGLVATFSRGNWLALLAGTAALAFVGERRFALGVLVTGAVAALVIDLPSGGAISARATSTLQDPLVGQRAALMLVGLLTLLEFPLFGVGPGGFGAALEQQGVQVSSLWDYTGSAHNAYLHMGAETGVLGLTALLLFFGVVFWRLMCSVRAAPDLVENDDRKLPRAVFWSFAVACAVSVVEWTFAHGVGQLIMLVAAMGLALHGRRAS